MNNKELIEYLENTEKLILPPGKTTENNFQDFKKELIINSPLSKGKFLKHIIAFANSGGEELSCIYYGIDETEDKNFIICGIDDDQVVDCDEIKDTISEWIYPQVNVDIILIYNNKIFADKKKVIQVVKIEKNSNRPYRFKKTIGSSGNSKKDKFVEGRKYYRDNHKSIPIPAIQEDEIIKKWNLQDDKSVKIEPLLSIIAISITVIDLISKAEISGKTRVFYRYYSNKSIFIASVLFLMTACFLNYFLGKEINKRFDLMLGELIKDSENLYVEAKKIIYLFLIIIYFFVYEILHISCLSYLTSNAFGCSSYYDSCNYDFINLILIGIFLIAIFSAILIPLTPFIKKIINLLSYSIKKVVASRNI